MAVDRAVGARFRRRRGAPADARRGGAPAASARARTAEAVAGGKVGARALLAEGMSVAASRFFRWRLRHRARAAPSAGSRLRLRLRLRHDA